MFTYSKRLSLKISYLLSNSDLTVKELSELSGISTTTINNIIHQKQLPTLKTLERLCFGLSLSPNDFLCAGQIKIPDKFKSKFVNKITVFHFASFPLCPACKTTLEREYQPYCDRCGCKLNWQKYSTAKKIYK